MMNFDWIEDGLWLGPAPTTPEDYAALAGLGITDVLTLQPEEEARQRGVHPDVAFRIAAGHGMVIHRVPIEDFSMGSLIAELPRAVGLLSRLRARGRKVYVHCYAGVTRSATTVSGYLMASRGLGPEEAAAEVRAHRACAPEVPALETLGRK